MLDGSRPASARSQELALILAGCKGEGIARITVSRGLYLATKLIATTGQGENKGGIGAGGCKMRRSRQLFKVFASRQG